MLIQILKAFAVLLVGTFLVIISLLLSRSVLCDDIREHKGKNVLRKLPLYKDGAWKWFFLVERRKSIAKWRYAFFIVETALSMLCVMLIASSLFFDYTKISTSILTTSGLVAAIAKGALLIFPWGRYRN